MALQVKKAWQGHKTKRELKQIKMQTGKSYCTHLFDRILKQVDLQILSMLKKVTL